MKLSTLLPAWLRHYRRTSLSGDATAGLVVAVMLIPQSLAYALLAGLPPEVGLYASILPVIAYAALGSSMTTAVGPVAVTALMTASALAPWAALAPAGSAAYATLAAALAGLSGLMLLAFGLLRLGFLAHFLSHPVTSGFVSGSAVLIAVGQMKHVLGVKVDAHNLPGMLWQLAQALPQTQAVTLAVGGGSLAFMWLARGHAARLLQAAGLSPNAADLGAKLAPMLAVAVATALAAGLDLAARHGLAVVGAVPQGLPVMQLPWPGAEALRELLLPAALISLVGFVGSVSVAQTLALKRSERIVPDRELLGLGAANVASAVSGGFPVTGGFSRSVVNFAAGAQTPLAGVFTAMGMAIVIAAFTGLFFHLPQAVLGATIIVAVTGLIDFKTLRDAWRYDRADALALLATAAGVVLAGVEAGIAVGVVLSLGVLVWRSSRPHIAVIGRVPGTQHFRNLERHRVQTVPGLLALRVDESLFFANASAVEAHIEARVAADPGVRQVLLVCSAVNAIDATALGVLSELEQRLAQRGVQLLLAEVKGPVMDRLQPTPLGQRLRGRVFLSTHEAFLHAAEPRAGADADARAASTSCSASPPGTSEPG